MSRTPCFSSFFGIGSMPHSGMPGPPTGPALRSTSTCVGGDVEILVVDRAPSSSRIVVEHQRRARCGASSSGRAGGRLDDRAVGREVAAQHRERALG